MTEAEAINLLREGIRRRARMSSKARFADMVRRGVIAPDGTVLIRMPIGPRPSEEAAPSKGASRSSRKKRKA